MPFTTEERFPSVCHDVGQFNSALLRWLFRSAPGATLGQSHDEVVATVPLGEEQCVLRGGTTRDGVADYLQRTLTPNAAFFVVPSTNKVIHRVTVGREGRIRGFYLYTPHAYERPRPLASADGKPFQEPEVWFKLMDAVALLHTRGHQRLRVISTLGDITARFYVVLVEGIDDSYGYTAWRHESVVLAFSMAQQFHVGSLLVGPDTPVSAVADEILAGNPDKGIGIDWAYAGWFAELVAEARRLRAIPLDESEFGSWRLVGNHGSNPVPFPPPPAYPGRLGFTDVFPSTHSRESGRPETSPRHEGSDVTRLPDTALIASYSDNRDFFIGLFALTPEADYRRQRGKWVRYEKDDEIYEDVLVPVSYRFITAFDFLEAHGQEPNWSLADRMRVFSGPTLGPSGKNAGPHSADGEDHGPDLMTAKEIVDTYGVALKTVQRWVQAGKLHPAMKLPGKTGAHLFTREESEHAFGNHRKHKKTTKAPSPTDATAPEISVAADPPTQDSAGTEAAKPVSVPPEPMAGHERTSREGDHIVVDLSHAPHTEARARSLASVMAGPGETLEYLPNFPESSATHYVFAVINPQPMGDFNPPFTYRYG